ncbi:MAG: SCO family protein [Vulcanimicrobiaceae bacterium]
MTATVALLLVSTPAGARVEPQLRDQAGHRFTLSLLHGTPVVVTFVAAHCTDACPLVNAQFMRADQELAQERIHVKLLTITLDPENDTPIVMKKLARQFTADPNRWILASGSVADVHALMRRFGVVTQRGANGYADVHSTMIYFLDAQGRVEKTLLASTDLADQVVQGIRQDWQQLDR